MVDVAHQNENIFLFIEETFLYEEKRPTIQTVHELYCSSSICQLFRFKDALPLPLQFWLILLNARLPFTFGAVFFLLLRRICENVI